MICPKCSREKVRTIDSRRVYAQVVRRRKQCRACKYRFTTYERISGDGEEDTWAKRAKSMAPLLRIAADMLEEKRTA